jgi:hypothetical protein
MTIIKIVKRHAEKSISESLSIKHNTIIDRCSCPNKKLQSCAQVQRVKFYESTQKALRLARHRAKNENINAFTSAARKFKCEDLVINFYANFNKDT